MSASRRVKPSETEMESYPFRVLFEKNPMPMWVFDRGNFAFLDVNEAAVEKYGYSREEFLGMRVTDVRPKEDVPRFLKHMESMPERLNQVGDWLHRDKSGRTFAVQVTAHSLVYKGRKAVLSLVYDDAGRKADILLRQQAAAMRASMDGMAILDEHENYVYVNEAHAAIYGYDHPRELAGKSWKILYDEPELRRFEREIMPTFRKTGQWRGEAVGRKRDGASFAQEVCLTSIDGGGLVCVVRDISAHKRSDEERARLLSSERAARTEAESANRAKDEFLAVISHELRTPMTAMLGWFWLLRSRPLDGESYRRAFDIVERNMKLQAQIIEDLLDVSSIITGRLRVESRPVELEPVIRAAMDVVRLAAEAKSIQLLSSLEPSGPVLGDPDRIQQVAWNLLSNAIKFTPEGGRVLIRLRRVDAHAEIMVTDSGQGIDHDFLPYLFNRFRQEESAITRTHRGLGLGLAIVRHIVELHGGTVNGSSDGPGRGTTFTVTLPVATVHVRPAESYVPEPGPPLTAEAPKTQGKTVSLKGVRVLLVDDDDDTRDMLVTLLHYAGASVTAVASAAAALEELGRKRPDVLLSDIAMPGEDGYALIRKVRSLPARRGGDVPALALTACTRFEDRARALSSGFQMYLAKPVKPSELAQAVDQLAKSDPNRP